MAEQPTSSAPPSAPRPAARGRWYAADMSLRLAEKRIPMAVLETAMQEAGVTSFGSPDEAQACIDAFLKKPISRTYPPGKPDDDTTTTTRGAR